MSLRFRRILQFVFVSILAIVSLSLAMSAITSFGDSGFPGLLAAFLPLLFGIIPVGALELSIRSIKKAGLGVRASIDECSKSAFDAPGTVRPGYDIGVTAYGPMAAFMSEPGYDAAFTTDGTYRGARVSIASHISSIGRQVGEFQHTYSHVVVDVLGLGKPFRLSKERASAKLGKVLGVVTDVSVGDEDFDKTFVIATDEAFARDVLDESIRSRILQLQGQVGNVSLDYGAGGMSLLLTNRGLAIRWPGAIHAPLAIFMRDLLLDMRERMLAHENRKAARVGETTGGYRVGDDEPPATREQQEAENATRTARQ